MIQFTPIAQAELICRDWRQLEYWVCDLEATQPGVTVARPIVLTYEPKFMWDGIHLNAAGVEKFMPVVAKDVEAVLGK
jgi:lysophospholipase L1-like esterase